MEGAASGAGGRVGGAGEGGRGLEAGLRELVRHDVLLPWWNAAQGLSRCKTKKLRGRAIRLASQSLNIATRFRPYNLLREYDRLLCKLIKSVLRRRAAAAAAAAGGEREREREREKEGAITEEDVLSAAPSWVRELEPKIRALRHNLPDVTATRCRDSQRSVQCAVESRVHDTLRAISAAAAAAARGGADTHAALARTAALAGTTIQQTTLIWEQLRSVSMSKLRLLVSAGDVTAGCPPAARLTPLDWFTVDINILYFSDDPLIDEESMKQYDELSTLTLLFSLVQHFQLTENPAREQWRDALRAYRSRGRSSSIVVLQRRWYELVGVTRAKFAAATRQETSAVPTISPLVRQLAVRFPELVSTPRPRWEQLVREGKIFTTELDEYLNEEENQSSDPHELCYVPNVTTSLHVHGEDDDLVLIEEDVDTVDLLEPSDSDTEERDAPEIAVKQETHRDGQRDNTDKGDNTAKDDHSLEPTEKQETKDNIYNVDNTVDEPIIDKIVEESLNLLGTKYQVATKCRVLDEAPEDENEDSSDDDERLFIDEPKECKLRKYSTRLRATAAKHVESTVVIDESSEDSCRNEAISGEGDNEKGEDLSDKVVDSNIKPEESSEIGRGISESKENQIEKETDKNEKGTDLIQNDANSLLFQLNPIDAEARVIFSDDDDDYNTNITSNINTNDYYTGTDINNVIKPIDEAPNAEINPFNVEIKSESLQKECDSLANKILFESDDTIVVKAEHDDSEEIKKQNNTVEENYSEIKNVIPKDMENLECHEQIEDQGTNSFDKDVADPTNKEKYENATEERIKDKTEKNNGKDDERFKRKNVKRCVEDRFDLKELDVDAYVRAYRRKLESFLDYINKQDIRVPKFKKRKRKRYSEQNKLPSKILIPPKKSVMKGPKRKMLKSSTTNLNPTQPIKPFESTPLKPKDESHEDSARPAENNENNTDFSENRENDVDLIENRENDVDLSENRENDVDLSEKRKNDVYHSENDVDLSEKRKNDVYHSDNDVDLGEKRKNDVYHSENDVYFSETVSVVDENETESDSSPCYLGDNETVDMDNEQLCLEPIVAMERIDESPLWSQLSEHSTTTPRTPRTTVDLTSVRKSHTDHNYSKSRTLDNTRNTLTARDFIIDPSAAHTNTPETKYLLHTRSRLGVSRTKSYHSKELVSNPDFTSTLKDLSGEFVATNFDLLNLCSPATVDLEDIAKKLIRSRLKRKAEQSTSARETEDGASETARRKKVSLVDIDEVRRQNSAILTAQVRPIYHTTAEWERDGDKSDGQGTDSQQNIQQREDINIAGTSSRSQPAEEIPNGGDLVDDLGSKPEEPDDSDIIDIADSESESEPDLDPDYEPPAKLKTRPGPKSKVKPQPPFTPGPRPKLKARPGPKSKIKPQPQFTPDPRPKLKARPGPKSKMKPQPQFTPDPRPKPESKARPGPKSKVKPRSESTSEPNAKPSHGPEPEPSREPEPEPILTREDIDKVLKITQGLQSQAARAARCCSARQHVLYNRARVKLAARAGRPPPSDTIIHGCESKEECKCCCKHLLNRTVSAARLAREVRTLHIYMQAVYSDRRTAHTYTRTHTHTHSDSDEEQPPPAKKPERLKTKKQHVAYRNKERHEERQQMNEEMEIAAREKEKATKDKEDTERRRERELEEWERYKNAHAKYFQLSGTNSNNDKTVNKVKAKIVNTDPNPDVSVKLVKGYINKAKSDILVKDITVIEKTNENDSVTPESSNSTNNVIQKPSSLPPHDVRIKDITVVETTNDNQSGSTNNSSVNVLNDTKPKETTVSDAEKDDVVITGYTLPTANILNAPQTFKFVVDKDVIKIAVTVDKHDLDVVPSTSSSNMINDNFISSKNEVVSSEKITTKGSDESQGMTKKFTKNSLHRSEITREHDKKTDIVQRDSTGVTQASNSGYNFCIKDMSSLCKFIKPENNVSPKAVPSKNISDPDPNETKVAPRRLSTNTEQNPVAIPIKVTEKLPNSLQIPNKNTQAENPTTVPSKAEEINSLNVKTSIVIPDTSTATVVPQYVQQSIGIVSDDNPLKIASNVDTKQNSEASLTMQTKAVRVTSEPARSAAPSYSYIAHVTPKEYSRPVNRKPYVKILPKPKNLNKALENKEQMKVPLLNAVPASIQYTDKYDPEENKRNGNIPNKAKEKNSLFSKLGKEQKPIAATKSEAPTYQSINKTLAELDAGEPPHYLKLNVVGSKTYKDKTGQPLPIITLEDKTYKDKTGQPIPIITIKKRHKSDKIDTEIARSQLLRLYYEKRQLLQSKRNETPESDNKPQVKDKDETKSHQKENNKGPARQSTVKPYVKCSKLEASIQDSDAKQPITQEQQKACSSASGTYYPPENYDKQVIEETNNVELEKNTVELENSVVHGENSVEEANSVSSGKNNIDSGKHTRANILRKNSVKHSVESKKNYVKHYIPHVRSGNKGVVLDKNSVPPKKYYVQPGKNSVRPRKNSTTPGTSANPNMPDLEADPESSPELFKDRPDRHTDPSSETIEISDEECEEPSPSLPVISAVTSLSQSQPQSQPQDAPGVMRLINAGAGLTVALPAVTLSVTVNVPPLSDANSKSLSYANLLSIIGKRTSHFAISPKEYMLNRNPTTISLLRVDHASPVRLLAFNGTNLLVTSAKIEQKHPSYYTMEAKQFSQQLIFDKHEGGASNDVDDLLAAVNGNKTGGGGGGGGGGIRVRAFASETCPRDAGVAGVAGVAGGGGGPSELEVDGKLYKKLNDHPLMYAQVWSVLNDKELLQSLAPRANISFYNTITGTVLGHNSQ